MKILIAPLNWGLGHAARSIALVVRHLRAGDEVVLAGDGDSLTLLRKHFPNLRYYTLPALNLRYSRSRSQVWALAHMLPKLFFSIRRDHLALEKILDTENFDLVISDNRFGCYTRRTRCAYITHQLMVKMPRGFQWAEPLVHRWHLRQIARYTECWVPDYAEAPGLSGDLSHHYPLPSNARFIGPLSRFEFIAPATPSAEYDVVAVLSGLEPQRTLLEQQLLHEFVGTNKRVLIVRGKVNEPPMSISKKNVTLRPYLPDAELASALLGASLIISRSGYSSLMDYAALGLLPASPSSKSPSLRLIPTPGQPEQEYLAALHS